MPVIISEVAKDFLKYYRANPGWGIFHCILGDGNWDGIPNITDYAKEEKAGKLAIRLAESLETMEPWQSRRIAEVIPEMKDGIKFTDDELDAIPQCGWCGGEVDEDGECLLDYCKGNHG